jgi:hypothetical protein
MSIKEDTEFYLFMDMHADHKWVSFNMTPHKWVAATTEYNTRLEALNATNSRLTIKKNPRALMDLLGVIEPKITECIIKGDFVCEFSFLFLERFSHSFCSSQTQQDQHVLEKALRSSLPGQGRAGQHQQRRENGTQQSSFCI